MFVAGLTGGIGAGKSSVAGLLARHGAAIVDADVAARTVMAPGGSAYAGVARRFPGTVGGGDGEIDRRALATTVFADPAARADLEALTHPAIRSLMAGEIAEHAASAAPGTVVVAVIPLLVESGRPPTALDAVIVVDCPPAVALARLQQRGLAATEARARMAAQVDRPRRLAAADYVIDNGGTPEELAREVARCWEWIRCSRLGSHL